MGSLQVIVVPLMLLFSLLALTQTPTIALQYDFLIYPFSGKVLLLVTGLLLVFWHSSRSSGLSSGPLL